MDPCWWCAVAVLPLTFLLIKWLTQKKENPVGIYSVSGCNGLVKKAWAACIISWRQRKVLPRMNNYDFNSVLYENCGLVPSKEEIEMESLKPLGTSVRKDSMFMFGVDNSGNSVILKLTRKPGRIAEVWLHVHLNGKSYQFPGHPDSTVYNVDDRTFSGAGLKFQAIEPMRSWRVMFNGLLREGARHEWTEDNENLIHVQFNFLWKALMKPFDWGQEFTPLLADAVAGESWKDVFAGRYCDSCSDGYDQWGALYGTVKVGDAAEEVYYVRGMRERRWETADCTAMSWKVNIYGCMENGTFFTFGGWSHTEGLTHLLYGHVKTSNGGTHPISKCNLSLPELAEGGNIPRNFVVRFCANKTWYTAVIHTRDSGFRVFSERPWKSRTDIILIDCTMNFKEGSGIAEFTYRYNGKCLLQTEESLPLLTASKMTVNRDSPLVVNLTDVTCQSTTLVGGKGSSLALMATINDSRFTVPPGFCLTVAGYESQLRATPELHEVARSVAHVAGRPRHCSLQEICTKATDMFAKCELCQVVKEATENALNQNFPDGWADLRFAVRSSAVGEDSEELSAAGQNDTRLGCRGLLQITEAVAQCWASLFTLQSVEYRRQHGQPILTGMGVVVQRMVEAEAAGVMFTRHPLTSNPAHIVITANYGLGESVVSASAEPDTVILKRGWDDSLEVEQHVVGSKRTKVVMQENGGTKEEKVDSDNADHICLSNETAVTLGEAGILLEMMFGGPRDIEWAVSKGNIFLLQARPVTSFDTWSEFELTHEMDGSILTDKEHNTKANTGEVFPGVTTPLTISTVVKALDLNVQRMFLERRYIKVPYTYTPHTWRSLTVTHNHVVINMLNTLLYMNETNDVSVNNHALDLALFGHQVTDSAIYQLGVERNGILSTWQKFTARIQFLQNIFLSSMASRDAREHCKHFTLITDEGLPALELYRKISSRLPQMFAISKYHCITSQNSTALQLISLFILTEGKSDWTVEHYSDFAGLFSSCSVNVESADVPVALKELAASIADSEEATQFASMAADEAVSWLQTKSGETGRNYKDFLKKHGHRCIREFDLRSLPWDLEPKNLVHILQSMVKNPDSYTWKRQEVSIEKAVESTKSPLKPMTKRVFKFILPHCYAAIRARENTKSLLIQTVHQFRLAYRTLAKRMVQEGRLLDPDLIYFFTHRELGHLLETRSPALLAKAIRRQRLHPQLDALQFPEIIVGIPVPLNVEEEAIESTLRIIATPVSQGKAKGLARVVLTLAEASTIQKGDILITYSTDVGWSPYFPLLGGVVTELGGLISHGAVVAREYGLPCIVGAQRATRIFKSGEVVVLDGSKGSLEKLS